MHKEKLNVCVRRVRGEKLSWNEGGGGGGFREELLLPHMCSF